MSHLVDSDYLIDALAGIPVALRTLEGLGDDGPAVSIVSHGELFEGAFGAPDPAARLRRIRDLLAGFVTFPLTDPIMEGFGRLRASLRRQGLLIPDLDLLIAATALTHDLTLVTRNRRHFVRIEGLRLDRPS